MKEKKQQKTQMSQFLWCRENQKDWRFFSIGVWSEFFAE